MSKPVLDGGERRPWANALIASLVEHYPTGPHPQPMRWAGWRPVREFASLCTCGAVFVGPSEAAARRAWAEHFTSVVE